jgi:hypothetical protein
MGWLPGKATPIRRYTREGRWTLTWVERPPWPDRLDKITVRWWGKRRVIWERDR